MRELAARPGASMAPDTTGTTEAGTGASELGCGGTR
jgi:hypothetical protein